MYPHTQKTCLAEGETHQPQNFSEQENGYLTKMNQKTLIRAFFDFAPYFKCKIKLSPVFVIIRVCPLACMQGNIKELRNNGGLIKRIMLKI